MARKPIDLPAYEEPPEPYERRAPLDRYAHLPEETRRWLEQLREDDVTEMREAIRFYRTARTVGKVNAWIIATIVTLFMGGMAFGEGILKAIGWIRGTH